MAIMAFRALCSCALFSADMPSGCVLILASTFPLYHSHTGQEEAYESNEALQKHALDLSHATPIQACHAWNALQGR